MGARQGARQGVVAKAVAGEALLAIAQVGLSFVTRSRANE